jgi:hypothetical protein
LKRRYANEHAGHEEIELDPLFMNNYSQWLEDNVYNTSTDREDLIMWLIDSKPAAATDIIAIDDQREQRISENTTPSVVESSSDSEYEGLSGDEMTGFDESVVQIQPIESSNNNNGDEGIAGNVVVDDDNDILISRQADSLMGGSSDPLGESERVEGSSLAMHVDELDF